MPSTIRDPESWLIDGQRWDKSEAIGAWKEAQADVEAVQSGESLTLDMVSEGSGEVNDRVLVRRGADTPLLTPVSELSSNQAAGISVNTDNFDQIPDTATDVQSALDSVDDLLGSKADIGLPGILQLTDASFDGSGVYYYDPATEPGLVSIAGDITRNLTIQMQSGSADAVKGREVRIIRRFTSACIWDVVVSGLRTQVTEQTAFQSPTSISLRHILDWVFLRSVPDNGSHVWVPSAHNLDELTTPKGVLRLRDQDFDPQGEYHVDPLVTPRVIEVYGALTRNLIVVFDKDHANAGKGSNYTIIRDSDATGSFKLTIYGVGSFGTDQRDLTAVNTWYEVEYIGANGQGYWEPLRRYTGQSGATPLTSIYGTDTDQGSLVGIGGASYGIPIRAGSNITIDVGAGTISATGELAATVAFADIEGAPFDNDALGTALSERALSADLGALAYQDEISSSSQIGDNVIELHHLETITPGKLVGARSGGAGTIEGIILDRGLEWNPDNGDRLQTSGALGAKDSVGTAEIDDKAVSITKIGDGPNNALVGFNGSGVASHITAGAGVTINNNVITADAAAAQNSPLINKVNSFNFDLSDFSSFLNCDTSNNESFGILNGGFGIADVVISTICENTGGNNLIIEGDTAVGVAPSIFSEEYFKLSYDTNGGSQFTNFSAPWDSNSLQAANAAILVTVIYQLGDTTGTTPTIDCKYNGQALTRYLDPTSNTTRADPGVCEFVTTSNLVDSGDLEVTSSIPLRNIGVRAVVVQDADTASVHENANGSTNPQDNVGTIAMATDTNGDNRLILTASATSSNLTGPANDDVGTTMYYRGSEGPASWQGITWCFGRDSKATAGAYAGSHTYANPSEANNDGNCHSIVAIRPAPSGGGGAMTVYPLDVARRTIPPGGRAVVYVKGTTNVARVDLLPE